MRAGSDRGAELVDGDRVARGLVQEADADLPVLLGGQFPERHRLRLGERLVVLLVAVGIERPGQALGERPLGHDPAPPLCEGEVSRDASPQPEHESHRRCKPCHRGVPLAPPPESIGLANGAGLDRFAAEPAFQIAGQGVRRFIPSSRLLLQALQDHRLQVAIEAGSDRRRVEADRSLSLVAGSSARCRQ